MMNRAQHIVFFFVAALILASCTKDDPRENTLTPIFYAEGLADGTEFSWKAGENSLYMHSDYASDSLSVFSFQGMLAPTDCETGDCPKSLHVAIRDVKTSAAPSETDPTTALEPGNLLVRNLTDTALTGYRVNLSAGEFNNGYQYNYSWTTSTGLTSTERNPSFVFPASTTGAVNVCLSVEKTDGSCVSDICYDIYPANECDVDFHYSIVDNVCYLYAQPSGNNMPYDFQWEVGHSQDPLSAQVKYEINALTAYTEVCLTATDADGCVAQKCKNVIINPDFVACASNFNHTKEAEYALSNEDLREVTIVWFNENGERFSSENGIQPDETFFTILETEEHTANRQNLPTSKVRITFNCMLYSEDGSQQIWFENVDAVVAIAHP